MKQVININFQGRVVPIEVTAFDLLKQYTESLNRHFANEEGKEEIINDIESRIGELFQERLQKGATCITDDDVNAIIKSMGRPEEFEGDEDRLGEQARAANNETREEYNANAGQPQGHKRLYRDENNKILGGVCAGIANYLGIDSLIVRILFVITGVGFFVYILLWIFLPNSSETQIGVTRKKLYRDSDDKLIGGVCSGIANYFGINVWIPRVLFALPFLSIVFRWGHWGVMDFPDFLRVGFSPGALIFYIILWMVIPEAHTTAEKLEMKGEKIDLNSIKNSVMEEMKGVQDRAKKFGAQAASFGNEKAQAMNAELAKTVKRTGSSFGDIIALMAKIFAYFIIGCIGFAVVAALFGLGVFALSIFPLKDFLITDGWQNAYAWGTLIFFIAVPLIGIITWIIRKLAKVKTGSKMIRLSFISLWILGWACFILLISSVSRDFKRTAENISEEEVVLTNPSVNKLELTSESPLQKFRRGRWLRFEPFSGVDEDTAYVKNFDIQIVKSTSDSFRVTMVKMADGRTRQDAEYLAQKIKFNMQQKDTILHMDKGIAINKTDKFRNQRIIIRIYVPVGKQIRIGGDIGWINDVHFNTPFNDGDFGINFDDEEHDWISNFTYIMKADGLHAPDGRTALQVKDEQDNNRNNRWRRNRSNIKINEHGVEINTEDNGNDNGDNYRYSPGTTTTPSEPANRIDSLKQKLDLEKQRTKDSLKKAIEKTQQQLEKIDKASADIDLMPLSVYKAPFADPMATFN